MPKTMEFIRIAAVYICNTSLLSVFLRKLVVCPALSVLSTLPRHLLLIQYLLLSEEIQVRLCIDTSFQKHSQQPLMLNLDAYGESSHLVELVL